jgi:hypothetical protein
VDDPAIPSTAALNDVHRAALLFVWRGVLGNEPGKYEGLREELEGLLKSAIGEADVPLKQRRKLSPPKRVSRIWQTWLQTVGWSASTSSRTCGLVGMIAEPLMLSSLRAMCDSPEKIGSKMVLGFFSKIHIEHPERAQLIFKK